MGAACAVIGATYQMCLGFVRLLKDAAKESHPVVEIPTEAMLRACWSEVIAAALAWVEAGAMGRLPRRWMAMPSLFGCRNHERNWWHVDCQRQVCRLGRHRVVNGHPRSPHWLQAALVRSTRWPWVQFMAVFRLRVALLSARPVHKGSTHSSTAETRSSGVLPLQRLSFLNFISDQSVR